MIPHECVLKASAALVENDAIISPAFIEIKDGIITAIGDTNPNKNLEQIDLKNIFLLPGFVNAHCHLEHSHFGSLTEHEFVPWIKNLMTHDRQAQKSDIQNNILKLIKSGVTTVFDHIGQKTPLEYYELDFPRIIHFAEVVGALEDSSTENYNLQKKRKKKSSSPFYITPHAIHSVHENTLKKIFKSEPNHFSIHLGESMDEKLYFESRSGPLYEFIQKKLDDQKFQEHDEQSAIQYIHTHIGELRNSLIIHANYLSDTDLKILKSWNNICVVHCPGSFNFFSHKEFPCNKLFDKGIPLALGTDSHASNANFNFLNEIKLFLKKFSHKNIFDLMPILTTNACSAMGIQNVGQIKIGYHADIIGFKATPQTDFLEILTSRSTVDFTIQNRAFE